MCVLERRHILGGACVTEEVWPGARVSRASYVVSMLQPKVVQDLRLHDYGYRADPARPRLRHDHRRTGPDLLLRTRRRGRPRRSPGTRPPTPRRYPEFEALLARMADFLRPMMLREPPALGSKRLGDLLRCFARRAARPGLARRDVHELFRVMTMSVGDLLDEWFESDALKGALASTGVVGVWAGPRTPGTAYNLLHHALGELEGVSGLWGHVSGGMGAISMAIARSAEAAGATIRTGAAVPRSTSESGRVTGVTLDSGEQIRAPLVASGAHPRTTILELAGANTSRPTSRADMRRYRSRGGSVKVNCILSEPPRYEGVPAEEAELLLSTGIALCPSIDYLERAWQDATRGEPAEGPYVEIEQPSAVDDSLTDDGTFVMTMFTQYGPHDEAGWPEGAREALRGQRCLDIVAVTRPT